MIKGFAVLIFYSFLVPGYGLDYKIFDKDSEEKTGDVYHGRYTRDVHNPELLIPRQVREDGSFLTFVLPKYYDRQELEERKKRSTDANADADTVTDDLADHKLHLVLPFNGADHHVELKPYHDFISPELVVERRGENAATDPNNGIRFERIPDLQCHYRGHVRGHENSRAALSLCDGVAGYVITDQGRFFVEPLSESAPESEGQHIHMVYKRKAPFEDSHSDDRGPKFCTTGDDWETSWAEELEAKSRRDRMAGNDTSEKRAVVLRSIHRYLELCVVCDKKFLDHHKGTDYQQYLLTVLNMVSDFYHDASVGNLIDVIIVRIIYLEKEKAEIDLAISTDGDKTLESFAAWINKMNPKDVKHPNHHDIGVLVTRYDICSSDTESPCNLLGLAYVAAACNPIRAACINEDSGLMVGMTITHEVGHNLGCSHDTKEISGCEAQDKDKSYFMMSPYANLFTVKWSPCSRGYITTFLENLGDCLNDNIKKPNDKHKLPGMLPGAMYDPQQQCEIMFPDSSVCDTGGGNVCESLWCKLKSAPTKCTSKGKAAEGTTCGKNKWCIQKKCVEMGKRPKSVNGGWGKWSKPKECSRTCGGGTRFSERDCDNPKPANGGRYCVGDRKKFSTCNTSPCDPKKPSYQAVQCSAFDSEKVLADGLHTWKPYLGKVENNCALYCINEKNTYVELAKQAKDGTPCERGTKNMCIYGVCRKVGCDWEMDSNAIEDQCGICKGDGTQCTCVDSVYTVTGKNDYQKVVTVPKGSRNIKFEEKGPSPNTLAIKLEKGNTYVLNGNHVERQNGEYPCAGDLAIYEHPEPGKEQVFIRGPIDQDIQLQYCFYNPSSNPGVHYVFYAPGKGRSSGSSSPQYSWDFLDWSPCSAKCGGGTQLAQAACIEQQGGKVTDTFCKDIPRPDPKSRVCNQKPCGAKWRVSQWSRCSACGGKQGKQRRKVQCVKPAARAGGDDVEAELKACKGKAPKQTQPCTGSRPCRRTCAKKTRSNVFDDQNDADSERRPSLEEQRNIIDKLVDVGMTRYLEKTNAEHAGTRSEKRNVAADFKHLIDDWVAPSNDAELSDKRDCPQGSELSTAKPGSIVKDNVPSAQIVLLEAPILPDNSSTNMSDQAFEEEGDNIGIELDTSKMKIYKGAEAAQQLSNISHNEYEQSMNSTAEPDANKNAG